MPSQADTLEAQYMTKYAEAAAIDRLRERLRNADSVAGDVPVLAEFFHEVRTSSRSHGDGRYVALFDLDGHEWECRSVGFLRSGAHYQDPGADLSLSLRPDPLLPLDRFRTQVCVTLRRRVRGVRQRAANIKHKSDRAQ